MKIPPLFQAIVDNDNAREELTIKSERGEMSSLDWRTVGELVKVRKDLRRGAEHALEWNHNKGNTG